MSFLELENIQKKFATQTAVENFDLKVERGEFVSFLGPSGCGKTTTLRMIAGFESPTHGTIRLDGTEITNRPPNKRNVGMVFQSYALFPNMTVAQNIAFGLTVAHQPKDAIQRRVDEMLRLIHLPQLGNRYPYQLSGGQQQRVALARALAIQPAVLLLDEPLSALDAKIRVSLRMEIRTIQRDLGITTIYVTHDQEEAMSLSDRIVVMSEGRMEQVGTPFEIYNFPKTQFVASFVGTLNQLSARVIDAAAGTLEVEGQPIVARKITEAHNGETISIALRPEMVDLDGAGKDDEVNHLRGRVEETTFLGSIVRTRVKLRDSVISFDTFNNPNLTLPQRGAEITVVFPREAVLTLKRSGGTVESES
jgi:putative spermidine/putrescine transport system ATP-binding protein